MTTYRKDLVALTHEAQTIGEFGIGYTLWVATLENALDYPHFYDLVYQWEYSEGNDFEDCDRSDYYDLLVIRTKHEPYQEVRIPVPLIKDDYVGAFFSLAVLEEKNERRKKRVTFENKQLYNKHIERLLSEVEAIKSEYDLMAKARQYLKEDQGMYFSGDCPRVYGVEWVLNCKKLVLQRINPETPRVTEALIKAIKNTYEYCTGCKFYTGHPALLCAVNPRLTGVLGSSASAPYCADKQPSPAIGLDKC